MEQLKSIWTSLHFHLNLWLVELTIHPSWFDLTFKMGESAMLDDITDDAVIMAPTYKLVLFGCIGFQIRKF